LKEKKGARVACYHDGSIDSQPEDLEALAKWVHEKLILFREGLFPAVQKIIE